MPLDHVEAAIRRTDDAVAVGFVVVVADLVGAGVAEVSLAVDVAESLGGRHLADGDEAAGATAMEAGHLGVAAREPGTEGLEERVAAERARHLVRL
jgi:hypothetical protein